MKKYQVSIELEPFYAENADEARAIASYVFLHGAAAPFDANGFYAGNPSSAEKAEQLTQAFNAATEATSFIADQLPDGPIE